MLPCSWCKDVYQCKVALAEPIEPYLSFLFELALMKDGGWQPTEEAMRIYGNPAKSWRDLGDVCRYIDSAEDKRNLSAVSGEMIRLISSMRTP